MNRRSPIPFQLTAASILVLAASGALAQQTEEGAEQETPYTPLGLANRPVALRAPSDHAGTLQLGAGYTTDHTDSWVVLEVSGKATLSALERLCPLNLDLDACPNDQGGRPWNTWAP